MKDKTAPASVIVSAYGNAELLNQALESVYRQTVKPAEIIVCDDCSPSEIVNSYNLKSDVHFLRSDKRHGSAAHGRNLGLQIATSDFIAFLDMDDVWLPNKLEMQLLELQQNDNAAFTYCSALLTDSQLNPIKRQKKQKAIKGSPFLHILKHSIKSPSLVLARRSAIMEVGYFDENVNGPSDWDMWLRLSAKYPVINSAQQLALKRERRGSISSDKERMLNGRIMILRKALDEGNYGNKSYVKAIKRTFSNVLRKYAVLLASNGKSNEAAHYAKQAVKQNPFNLRAIMAYIRVIISFMG